MCSADVLSLHASQKCHKAFCDGAEAECIGVNIEAFEHMLPHQKTTIGSSESPTKLCRMAKRSSG